MSNHYPPGNVQAQSAAVALGALSFGATEERVEDQQELVERDAGAGNLELQLCPVGDPPQTHSDTLDGWERSFRRDCNPDREIRTWLWIAETYSEFASGKWQSDVRKRDYFQLCLGRTLTHDADALTATTELRCLEAGEAKEILAEFPQREVNIETLLIRNPLVSDSPPIWEFMCITCSAQFNEALLNADAIVAIDTRSNTEMVAVMLLSGLKPCGKRKRLGWTRK